MRIMVLSCVHGLDTQRKDIYGFFLRRMSHIKEKYGIDTLVVGSEGDLSKNMTEGAGLFYKEYANRPVSNKWNAGMEHIKQYNPDYVMILGSDDLVSDSLIEDHLKVADGGYDIFGIMDSYYVSLHPSSHWFNMCLYWPGYPGQSILGYAKCFSKGVLDRIEWRPWVKNKNAGLDFSVTKTLSSYRVKPTRHVRNIKAQNWLHIDLKTQANISTMGPLSKRATEANLEELIRGHLPDNEATPIMEYVDKMTQVYLRKKSGIRPKPQIG